MSTASKVGTAFEFKDKMTLEKVLSRAAEDGTKALIPKTYVAPWEQEVRCAVPPEQPSHPPECSH